VLYLIIIATSAVLYVGNVNDTTLLLKSIRKLEHKIEDLENRKKIINSKVKGLQSPERIIQIGTDMLNMKLSDHAPLFLEDKSTEDE
jgi:cell division protein FtsL